MKSISNPWIWTGCVTSIFAPTRFLPRNLFYPESVWSLATKWVSAKPFRRSLLCHLEKNHDQAHFTALVICPASITQNWVNEIEKFTSFFLLNCKARVATGLHSWIKRGGIAIVSYEVLKASTDTLDPVCVVDEAHYIRAKHFAVTPPYLRRSKYAVSMLAPRSRTTSGSS